MYILSRNIVDHSPAYSRPRLTAIFNYRPGEYRDPICIVKLIQEMGCGCGSPEETPDYRVTCANHPGLIGFLTLRQSFRNYFLSDRNRGTDSG